MRKILFGTGMMLVLVLVVLMSGSVGTAASLADVTPPTLTLPGNMTVEAAGPAGAPVSFTATATDDVDPSVVVTCIPGSGTTFGFGPTTVNCSATDTAGNTANGSFTVTVSDTRPPTLNLPGNITQPATGPSGAVVTFSAAATDTVDGTDTVTCTPASGETFPITSTSVSCSATDAAGNRATGGFTVTVTNTTPPTLHLPSDMTAEATSATGAAVTFSATATDFAGAPVAVTCTPISGSTFALGSTTVNCSATDTSGNTASGTFRVTVSDTKAPVLSLPGNRTVEATSAAGAAVTFTATATDAVDGSIDVVCAPASGSTFAFGTATVSCSATDKSSNRASGSFTVTVSDTTAPALHLPADMTVEATKADGAVAAFAPTATDTVGGGVAVTCAPASGSTFALGAATVSCSAKDAAGNTANGSFKVTVSDTIAPTLTLPTLNPFEADGPTGSKVTFTVSASDRGEPLPSGQITCTPASGTVFAPGTTHVTCKTAADPGGNIGEGTFDVVVSDTTAPILAVAPDSTVYGTTAAGIPASADEVTRLLAASAVDVVDPHPVVANDAPAVLPYGTTTVTFTGTDAAGNSSTRKVRITVVPRPAGGGGGAGGTTSITPKAIDTTPPANASSFVAKAGAGTVQLTWKLPTDSDFDHVEIFRSSERTTAAPIETRIYRGKDTSFVDRGLAAGARYRYLIASFDTAGNRSAGAVTVATPKALMLLAPAGGAKVLRVPVLRWKAVAGAAYYNVQIYRGTTKVLSAWPTATSLKLTLSWRYNGKSFKLQPAVYHWYVWPGLGVRAAGKYGPVLGDSTFTVLKGVKK